MGEVFVLIVGGIGMISCAAYLHVVALPEEHTRRHVVTRTALVVLGLVLVIAGTRLRG